MVLAFIRIVVCRVSMYPAATLIELRHISPCRNWRFRWLVSTDLKPEPVSLGE
jgi:hypothetical protein